MSILIILSMLAGHGAAVAVRQDAAPEPEYEEVVVTATAGRVALVFDKAADGRLINCRVFRSSGVATVDARACTALPDCVTSTKGQQYCGEGSIPLMAVGMKPKPEEPKLGLGVTLKPEPPRVPAVGPTVATKDDEDPNRLGKLPPPPKDESGGPPAITFGSGQTDEPR